MKSENGQLASEKINEIIGSEMETFAKYNVIFSIYLMFIFSATRLAWVMHK